MSTPEANASARTIEPGNEALAARSEAVGKLRRRGQTVPSRIGEEKATNPSLRADVKELRAAIGMRRRILPRVFGEFRRRQNASTEFRLAETMENVNLIILVAAGLAVVSVFSSMLAFRARGGCFSFS